MARRREEAAQADQRSERVSRVDEATNGTEAKPKRKTRLTARNRLSPPKLPPHLVGRFVNDDPPGRVYQFTEIGYDFWTKDGNRVGDLTGENGGNVGAAVTRQVGGGVTAYYMVIDKDLYDEAQQEKQEQLNDIEKKIFRKAKQAIGGYGDLTITRD